MRDGRPALPLAGLVGGLRPARPRTGADDSALVDVSTLPLYAAGVAPTKLNSLGGGPEGVVVPNGEFGGVLFTLNPTAPRPMAMVVGRPIWRPEEAGIFAWRTSRGWGEISLEYFAWSRDELAGEQLDAILAWSHGYAQPTIDVTASSSTPTSTKTTQLALRNGDNALFPRTAGNLFTVVRFASSNTSPTTATCTLNDTAADALAGGTVLSLSDSFGPWYGPLAYSVVTAGGEVIQVEFTEYLP